MILVQSHLGHEVVVFWLKLQLSLFTKHFSPTIDMVMSHYVVQHQVAIITLMA